LIKLDFSFLETNASLSSKSFYQVTKDISNNYCSDDSLHAYTRESNISYLSIFLQTNL